ncbi:MAG: glycosyl hydrolase-related protein [Thermoguttaceae bacterium]
MINQNISALIYLLVFTFLTQGISAFAQNYSGESSLPGAATNTTEPKTADSSDAKNVSPEVPVTDTVVIVYKTHFDIGYSETIQQVIHDYQTSMADMVLEAIEKNSAQPKENQFVWTISGWPMKQILSENQEPNRRKKIEDAIANGNLVIHGFPFTVHSETADLEDMVRGLNISSTISRKYNQPLSVSAKMTDVPGNSWLIPTLFTNAGMKFYHMGGPVVNMEHDLPLFFWWEGPDGSRLLTMYHNGYGTSQLPPEGWKHKTWLYINMTGDNQGPPAPETVAADVEFYKSRGMNPIVGSMDDFAELVLKEDLSGLPVVRKDISDVWIHGAMSQPEASKLLMNIRPTISGLEELTTLERIWGIYRPDLSTKIADAYENSLLYSEHTWGLANQHYVKVPYGEAWQKQWERGLPAQFQLMEGSWQDKADYVNRVKSLVTGPYLDAVSSLADNVEVQGNRMIVYNPLPWERDCAVEFDTRLIFGNNFVSLKPADGGDAIPVSHELPSVENRAPMSRFVVKNVPALGYRTYIASQEKAAEPVLFADEANGIIESPFFKAKIDAKSGRITSLIDKKTGREMVDSEAPQGFGQYYYERFSYKQIADWLAKSLYPQYVAHRFCFAAYDMPQDSVYESALPQDMELHIEKSPIDVKAVLTGTLPGPGQPQNVTISLILSGEMPTADIEVSWQKQPDTWPETAWICLPFKCENPKFVLGRLGAPADPETDMNVKNTNRWLWWLNNGLAVYDAKTGAGYGICSPDAPLVSVGEPGEYKFDQDMTPRKPYVYLNLYNNHWRTNFCAWIGNGQRMSAKVRLWAYEKFDLESSLYTPAMEAKVSVRSAASKVKNGKLPVTQPGVTLSRKGVSVTAFGPNPDGNGTILRLWEQVGVSDNCTVRLPSELKIDKVQPVNLRGEPQGEPIPVKEGEFSVKLDAYKPATFMFDWNQ